jgi:undecaprenyl-diphosphatase
MNWWQALILGWVEGLTEYLPVSSTGHLIVTQQLLGIPESDEANAFAICVQGGAIVAVLGLYAGRARQMLLGLAGRDPGGRKLLVRLLVAFFPAVVVGLLLDDWIEQFLFGMWPVVAAWIVGGGAILWMSRVRLLDGTRAGWSVEELSLRSALLIGIGQCVAMWPGTSRSLATIVSGVLVGLSLSAAIEFAFLLGLFTLGAATAYEGMKHGEAMLAAYGPVTLVIGFAASWVSAVLAVRWMVAYLKRRDMSVFGYWRIGLGVVVAALLLTGNLDPR